MKKNTKVNLQGTEARGVQDSTTAAATATSVMTNTYSNNNSMETSRNNRHISIEYQYIPEAEEAVEAKLKEWKVQYV
eukprot:5463104-Ditylum_brightwellii.AAC.1